MDIKAKMAAIEQGYIHLKELHQQQENTIKQLGELMLDVKQSVGMALGRTEKGDTIVNANTNIDQIDGDANISQKK